MITEESFKVMNNLVAKREEVFARFSLTDTMTDDLWKELDHFGAWEFSCKCARCASRTPGFSANNMKARYMFMLDAIRDSLGRRLDINSGYRCELHPIEKAKAVPGDHYQGYASDVAGTGDLPVSLVVLGECAGMTVYGMNHKGAYSSRYTHVAMRAGLTKSIVYSY